MCKPLFRPTPIAFSIGIFHLITESDRKKGRNVAEARAAAVIGAMRINCIAMTLPQRVNLFVPS